MPKFQVIAEIGAELAFTIEAGSASAAEALVRDNMYISGGCDGADLLDDSISDCRCISASLVADD